ncbi:MULTISPECIES: hypothetical protein [Planktothricoides]|uniref:Uncharacterized protein n=1 Tax=Planktothricoides raciborskii GIHE-MW2 TaxID=2792601 RepID=A0AAU8J8W7_9CYAN|nr:MULTISPECIES: hypothetical protein [Planktothricoides]
MTPVPPGRMRSHQLHPRDGDALQTDGKYGWELAASPLHHLL